MEHPKNSNKKIALNLAALSLGMFLLAYASVPLYRLFCEQTGYGGTTQTASKNVGKVFDREITVTFNADIDPGLAWSFAPSQKSMKVKVGESSLAFYRAKNLTKSAIKGHATYNVVPFSAGSYFVKVECFCFKEQTLAAGQEVDMPVSFYIDPAIMNDPEMKNLKTITLSYTFFPLKTK
ncbi:MAG: cytochrome c oxidase assembly protein [Alphaproteobacteria bacterium]|nr:cytochrome c oxidase assembly protein [Alphaproteobacteria bacterium]